MKTVSVTITPLLPPASSLPTLCVVKPPVDTVLHAVHTASTTPTPCTHSTTAIATVIKP